MKTSPDAVDYEFLIAQTLSKDRNEREEAADALSKAFGRWFYPMFRSRLKLSQADAEEFTVSAVTDVFRRLSQYSSSAGGNFRSWALTVAWHLALDWLRHRSLAAVSLEENDVLEPERNSHEPVCTRAARQAVIEALGKLSKRDQAVLEWRQFCLPPLDYGAIGEQLGCSSGTARIRYFRAIRKLHSSLKFDPRIENWRSPNGQRPI